MANLNNLNFVEYQAKKNKPIILSVGASNADEIRRSVKVIRKHNIPVKASAFCAVFVGPFDAGAMR